MKLDYGAALDATELRRSSAILNTLHDVMLWNGFDTDISSEQALKASGTGISVEMEHMHGAIFYLVERPLCDPALSILMLVEKVERLTGNRPEAWQAPTESDALVHC